MNPMRFAIGLAAVLLIVVIGFNLVPSGPGVGGGPAPTPTPTPTPNPTPIPIPLNPEALVVAERGTYAIGDPFPIPVTISVPAGWVGTVGGSYAAYLDSESGYAVIAFSLAQSVYADPCSEEGFLDPPPGPTVNDLAAALAALPGLDATSPADVTIDGYRGKQLVLTRSETFDDCTLPAAKYQVWQLPLGTIFTITAGQRMALWILDVNGRRLVISVATFQATTARELSDVQEILDSIRIEAVN
jgi:hypothetical protein